MVHKKLPAVIRSSWFRHLLDAFLLEAAWQLEQLNSVKKAGSNDRYKEHNF